MGGLIEARREGTACVLTLRRAEKLNALSAELEHELLQALEQPEVHGSRAVVLTGGGRAFSAGADVTEFRGNDPAAILAYYRESGAVYERVAALRQPTIAAIHGYCLGGGLELALACDFRVADQTAVFGFPEIGLGILPSSGGTFRLVRMLGPARAKELVLLRERFSASEALAFGVVTEVVEEGQALARALELAERLGALPAEAVAMNKRVIDLMPDASAETALSLEALAWGMLAQTDEADDAARAFEERRQPNAGGGTS
jgi:enoyl-CoA hydratase/carnithine racemase